MSDAISLASPVRMPGAAVVICLRMYKPPVPGLVLLSRSAVGFFGIEGQAYPAALEARPGDGVHDLLASGPVVEGVSRLAGVQDFVDEAADQVPVAEFGPGVRTIRAHL